MPKHIFVTGGVASSLGKGLTASSLGRLLKLRGLRVTLQKLDPYINIDPGTMNPFEHGEVFVTDDGGETDLDLGHYERFIDESLSRNSNATTGSIYQAVLAAEQLSLADGLEAAVSVAGLPWKVQRLYPRSGISFSGRLARDAGEADADEQPELNALLRLHLANRGVWEAISTAGPAMSVAATGGDVAAYLAAFGEFVADVTAPS